LSDREASDHEHDDGIRRPASLTENQLPCGEVAGRSPPPHWGRCGRPVGDARATSRQIAKAPGPRSWSRALFFSCTPSANDLEEWRPKERPCSSRCNAQTSSWLPLRSSGPTGISPVESSIIRSQDELPLLL